MFWRFYDRATTLLLALAGASMFAVAILNALLRYLLASPLIWGEELSRYAMVWGVMIGVALAYRAGHHVAIDLAVVALPPRLRRHCRVACHLLVLAASALMLHAGWVQVAFLGRIAAPSSGIAMGWAYAAVPVGAILLAVEAIRCLVADLRPLAAAR